MLCLIFEANLRLKYELPKNCRFWNLGSIPYFNYPVVSFSQTGLIIGIC